MVKSNLRIGLICFGLGFLIMVIGGLWREVYELDMRMAAVERLLPSARNSRGFEYGSGSIFSTVDNFTENSSTRGRQWKLP